jgi:hypothetical protein
MDAVLGLVANGSVAADNAVAMLPNRRQLVLKELAQTRLGNGEEKQLS